MNDHQKVLLRPERLRVVPSRFSWCDQRLFRCGATAQTDPESLALYLFLLTAADCQRTVKTSHLGSKVVG